MNSPNAQHPAVAADFTWVLDRHVKWTEAEQRNANS